MSTFWNNTIRMKLSIFSGPHPPRSYRSYGWSWSPALLYPPFQKTKKYFLYWKFKYLHQTFLSSFCNSFFFLSSRKAARAALKTALVRWVSVRPQDLSKEISWSRPVPVTTGSPVLTLNETFSSANWTIGW